MDIGSFFGAIFAPIGFIFSHVFYQPVFNVLMLVYAGVHNFALAIVILTLIIRVCLIPLTRAQLRSSKAMQELAPRLKEIQAQHRGDAQALMAAQQALYKEHGVSPAKGCLPLLVQMPFLYALYYSFFNVLKPHTETVAQHVARINQDIYPFLPHLRVPPLTEFFWTNLATPDPTHILPILAGVLTFIQLRMAMPVRKKLPPGQSDPTTQATSTMQYIMPFITVFFAWSFPSGLALYWCVSTLFSAVQQYFISGVGSLWVGVPGMERYVPAPKDLGGTLAVAGGPRSMTTVVGARSNIVAAAPPPAPASEGGWRGMLKQLREGMAAATDSATQQTAERATQNGPSNRTNGINNGASNGASNGAGASKATGSSATAAASAESADDDVTRSGKSARQAAAYVRDRRPRPAKAGPMLVKPKAPSRLPEQEIARDASSKVNGSVVSPEQAIAGDAANGQDASQ